MKLNRFKQLDSLCFSDFDVKKITINEKARIFMIEMEGIWLIGLNGNKELGPGYVEIKSYREIKPTYFNALKKEEGQADLNKVSEINEINEHEVTDDSLKIAGFANDGSWIECEVVGGVVKAVFLE